MVRATFLPGSGSEIHTGFGRGQGGGHVGALEAQEGFVGSPVAWGGRMTKGRIEATGDPEWDMTWGGGVI